MRHEIARLSKHSSHVVLFNFRGGPRVSIKERWGVKVSGRPDTVGAIDGVEYLAGVLENAQTFQVEEVLVPKKVVMMGLFHEDLSGYTKPNSKDNPGKVTVIVYQKFGEMELPEYVASYAPVVQMGRILGLVLSLSLQSRSLAR